MNTTRSILWIGSSDGLSESAVWEAPELDVTWTSDLDQALAVGPSRFDLALLDCGDPPSAARNLRRMRQHGCWPSTLVRLRTQEPEGVRQALAAGAADVLIAPAGAPPEALRDELIDRVRHLTRVRPGGKRTHRPQGLIAESRAMQPTLELVERAQSSTASVLVTGETGTGKEVVARAIHRGGERAKGEFVAVNCAAFPDTLLESELFGHVRGAFTGATRDKAGLIEKANGGTLFLDEVGDTSRALQAKLLRVLQEREIRPVGGERTRSIDVRLVSATNRDLRAETRRHAFRDDLYYRLAVFPIDVPPLRDRSDDILPLAEHFLALHGRREGKSGCRLSAAAGHLLLAYRWPGNVRELENEMQRALALADAGERITPALLSGKVTAWIEPVAPRPGEQETLREAVNRVEAWIIRRTLDDNDGRKAATARQLGITREGLYKKMKRLKVE